MKVVLTYGTFDLLHHGHVHLLKRAKSLGDYLIVAVSTEEFNELKGKHTYQNFDTRKSMLEAIRYVDLVIPERSWEQKKDDILKYDVGIVAMGGDWQGDPRFEALRQYCDVRYFSRTQGVSTTKIKDDLRTFSTRATF